MHRTVSECMDQSLHMGKENLGGKERRKVIMAESREANGQTDILINIAQRHVGDNGVNK